MKELVIFDLDDTILQGQSQVLFLKFLHEEKKISLYFYVKLLFWAIMYKISVLKNPKNVMRHAYSFVGGKTREEVDGMAGVFFDKVLVNKIYPEAITSIKTHLSNDRDIIIISNAPDFLVSRIASYLKIKNYICTRLEIIDGIYTGKIINGIMYGESKLKALDIYIKSNNLSLTNSWAYSDHESDVELLKKVDNPFVVNPTEKLKKLAVKYNWPIVKF